MKTRARAKVARQAAYAACLGLFLSMLPVAQARQHGGAPSHMSAPHFSAPPRSQPHISQPRGPQGRPAQAHPGAPPQQRYGRPQQGAGGYAPARPQPGYGGAGGPAYSGARPAYNGSAYGGGSPYAVRPNPNPQAAGHLPQWMAQHQNMPAAQQERLLRQEPGFNRLTPAQQQHQVQQLYRLNQMPSDQRDRRLARAENFERLSPMEQMQVRQSSSRLATLPPDRQMMVRRAFRDLRGVPVDQRETMLNSARYNATFSPQERGILSNLLRVEPYDGQR